MADWLDDGPDASGWLDDAPKAPLRPIEYHGKPRSTWQRFKDNLTSSALHNPFGGEAAIRGLIALRDGTGISLPGVDPRINSKNLNDYERQRFEQDASNSQNDTHLPGLQGRALETLMDVGANIIGGVDPTYVFAPGESVGTRIAAQGGINAVEDAASQGVELHRGTRDKYDPYETGIAGVGGLVLQGLGEGVGHYRLGRKIGRGAADPEFASLSDTVLHLEGGGSLDHPATSPKGARGPMQVMPDTARDPGFGIRPWDGKTEADRARVGRQYLAVLNDKYRGDKEKVLAAYNGGPGRVDKLVKEFGDNWLSHMPDESQKYVEHGLGHMGIAQAAESAGGDSVSPMAPEVLARVLNDPKAAGLAPEEEAILHQADDTDIPDAEIAAIKTRFDADPIHAEAKNLHENDLMTDDEYQRHVGEALDRAGGSNIENLGINRESSEVFDKYKHNLETAYGMKNEDIPENVSIFSEKANEKRAAHLDAKDAAYKKDMEGRYWMGRRILDAVKDGQSPMTLEELKDSRQEWVDIVDRMNRSSLPALGHDIAKDTLKVWDDIVAHAGGNPGSKGDGASKVLGKGSVATTPVNDFKAEAKPSKTILDHIKTLLDDEKGAASIGDDEPHPNDGHPAIEKLRDALTMAKPVRQQKARVNAQARRDRLAAVARMAAKTSGESGFHAELSQLKGNFPNVDYESLRPHFTQDDIDSLFDLVKTHPHLSLYDKITARAGLMKILGSEGGQVPTKGELSLLSSVLPKDIIDKLLSQRPLTERMWKGFINTVNIPRSIMASYDLSAPLRQGVFLVGRKEFYSAFATMFKQFGSKKAFDAVQDEIRSRPTYKLMRRAGLELTGADQFLEHREEAFMSEYAEGIPLVGKGIKMSNQAYTGFLNKLRADVFDSLVKESRKAGVDFGDDPKALKDIARFINAATGRGSLGKLNQAAPLLTSVLFSPRLMASRIQMLNPVFYMKLSPVVRKEAIKSLLTFSGMALTVLGLAKAGGAEVEDDPRSTDFAKIKIGDTRFDILGGFQQYIRLGAQLITNETKSTKTGEIKELGGDGFKPTTRLDVAERFLANKQSPVMAFVTDLLRGKDQQGAPITVSSQLSKNFIPLAVQDTIDAFNEYGSKGLLAGIPAMFGVGVQTYKPRPSTTKSKKPKNFLDDAPSKEKGFLDDGQKKSSHKNDWLND
jgi:soluble lytic murein transglycosylase